MSMSDWRSYGEGMSPEYKFPSGVPDFQNSVGAANAKIGRIRRTCIKKTSRARRIGRNCLPEKIFCFRAYLKHLQNRHGRAKLGNKCVWQPGSRRADIYVLFNQWENSNFSLTLYSKSKTSVSSKLSLTTP